MASTDINIVNRSWRAEKLFNELPLLPPVAQVMETTETLKACIGPATKEVLRYRTALKQGFEQLVDRPLCTRTAIQICSELKGSEMDIRKVPGTVIGNQSTGQILYTPPVGEQVIRELLAY